MWIKTVTTVIGLCSFVVCGEAEAGRRPRNICHQSCQPRSSPCYNACQPSCCNSCTLSPYCNSAGCWISGDNVCGSICGDSACGDLMSQCPNIVQQTRSVTNLSDEDIQKLIVQLQALQQSQLELLKNELKLKMNDETDKVTKAVNDNVDNAEVEIKKKIEEIPKPTM